MLSYESLFEMMRQKNSTSYFLQKVGFSRVTYYKYYTGKQQFR